MSSSEDNRESLDDRTRKYDRRAGTDPWSLVRSKVEQCRKEGCLPKSTATLTGEGNRDFRVGPFMGDTQLDLNHLSYNNGEFELVRASISLIWESDNYDKVLWTHSLVLGPRNSWANTGDALSLQGSPLITVRFKEGLLIQILAETEKVLHRVIFSLRSESGCMRCGKAVN